MMRMVSETEGVNVDVGVASFDWVSVIAFLISICGA